MNILKRGKRISAMRIPTFLACSALVALGLSTGVGAADRDTISSSAPSAQEVQKFLFPESACDNAQYMCMAVRPAAERSIGIDVRFHTGSAELTSEARTQLEGLGKAIAAHSNKLAPGEIVIEGHTDARGSDELNKKLSEQRAKAVAKHLVDNYGIDSKVLKPVGRGKENLRDKSKPDSEINRRVEMVRVTN